MLSKARTALQWQICPYKLRCTLTLLPTHFSSLLSPIVTYSMWNLSNESGSTAKDLPKYVEKYLQTSAWSLRNYQHLVLPSELWVFHDNEICGFRFQRDANNVLQLVAHFFKCDSLSACAIETVDVAMPVYYYEITVSMYWHRDG